MQTSSAASPALDLKNQVAAVTGTSVVGPLRVLLVEDNAEAAELVQLFLAEEEEGAEFCVEWTANLQQAMERLSQPGIEVVLLDLGLPELNGYKSFVAIDHAVEGRVPVIILTSDDRSVSKDLTLAYGASDYLLKNQISPEQLRVAISKAVRVGRPGRA
jgi:two-component system catabolic regulation response regulator CreB